ncbi:ribosome small subunit-dependent GTPase A [candidate division KSB1 bacterium]|nr:ribosome small subunit-dependent GTPase A [candidate division KSB1 bacterium]
MENTKKLELANLGWNTHFATAFKTIAKPELVPGRIALAEKNQYRILGEFGEINAEVAGKIRHQAKQKSQLPAVGDWVAMIIPDDGRALIEHILPRKTSVVRMASGSRKRNNPGMTEEQIIAANVDIIFIVTGLDRDYNPRRIERYLTLVYNSGASPIIVLNKADMCDNVEACRLEIEEIAFDVPIHTMSALNEDDVEPLLAYFKPGLTGALLGSSGAGKSTIINSLLGYERQKVKVISDAVNKGQHTTTHRELIFIPNGGLLMDNPGMREIQLSSQADDLSDTFGDIEELADSCRFNDCAHEAEPGCAVKQAIQAGELDVARFESYQKLKREMFYQAERQHKSANLVEKEKWQTLYKKAGKQFGLSPSKQKNS